jgi:hypothetical protein
MITDDKNDTEEVEEEEDDDFADFEAADYVPTSVEEEKVSTEANASNVQPVVQESFAVRIDKLIKSVFNEVVAEDTGQSVEEPVKLGEVSEISEKDEFLDHNANSKSVWNAIQGQGREEGLAPRSLKLKWPSTHAFQLFLSSLNIDQRNILRNSNMPAFAAGLGQMLEPKPLLPTSGSSNSLKTDNGTSEGQIQTDDTLDVKFDWTSSGLTNPLDASGDQIKSHTAANFDLDFFVTKEFGSKSMPSRVFSLEDELLGPESVVPEHSVTNDDVIANLLNGVKSTTLSVSSLSSSPAVSRKFEMSGLSSEANLILTELPDISFMSSLVLNISNTLAFRRTSKDLSDKV